MDKLLEKLGLKRARNKNVKSTNPRSGRASCRERV